MFFGVVDKNFALKGNNGGGGNLDKNFSSSMIILLITVAITIMGCGHKSGKDIVIPMAIDREYYSSLDEFTKEERYDNDEIRKYINIYIDYYGHDLPDGEVDYIREMTDESCFYRRVVSDFSNLYIIYGDSVIDDYSYMDPDEFIDERFELGHITIGDSIDDWLPTHYNISNLTLLELMYNYSGNTYVAKIGTPSGKCDFMYFTVEDGKVVKIFGY